MFFLPKNPAISVIRHYQSQLTRSYCISWSTEYPSINLILSRLMLTLMWLWLVKKLRLKTGESRWGENRTSCGHLYLQTGWKILYVWVSFYQRFPTPDFPDPYPNIVSKAKQSVSGVGSSTKIQHLITQSYLAASIWSVWHLDLVVVSNSWPEIHRYLDLSFGVHSTFII